MALTSIKHNVTLISRIRLDAQVYNFPVDKQNQRGRKPIKGKRIHLKALLQDPTQTWQTKTVNWYGDEQREVVLVRNSPKEQIMKINTQKGLLGVSLLFTVAFHPSLNQNAEAQQQRLWRR